VILREWQQRDQGLNPEEHMMTEPRHLHHLRPHNGKHDELIYMARSYQRPSCQRVLNYHQTWVDSEGKGLYGLIDDYSDQCLC